MNVLERAHVLHRAWRYRLRSERDELRFLRGRDLAGATVVDIGAYRGIYSYWMHKAVGPEGRVVAFEPQPELFAYLEDLKASFGLTRLQLINSGLSSHSGSATLNRPEGHWGGASLEQAASSANEGEAMDVALTTLDEHFAESVDRPVRFIKCDVEGHELAVFEGATRVLEEDRPDLLVECHDRYARVGKLFAYLQDRRYDGFFFVKGELTPIEKWSEMRQLNPLPYLNYIFTRND